MRTAYVVEWDEYEEGWRPRPDGVSVHTSKDKVKKWPDAEIMNYSKYHSSNHVASYEKEVSEKFFSEIKKAGGSKKFDDCPW